MEGRKKVSVGTRKLHLSARIGDGTVHAVSFKMEGVTPVQDVMLQTILKMVNFNLQQGVPISKICNECLNVQGHPVIEELAQFLGECAEDSGSVVPSLATPLQVAARTISSEGGKEKCGGCGATQLRQNGTCMLCEVCGTTTGCS